MNTRMFAYRGVLGVMLDMENGEFLNDPKGPGQLGCVVASHNVDVTKEAKEALRNANREGGSFAPIMLTKHEGEATAKHGKSSLGILGGNNVIFKPEDILIGRTCETEVIDDFNEVEMEVPEGFKEVVDSYYED